MGHYHKRRAIHFFVRQMKASIILPLLCLLYYETIHSQTLSAEQIYERVKDAVVVILAYDYADKISSQGSGVVLNDKGYVVTNYHVLSGNERLEIMHGEEIIPYVDIIGIDVEKDILILKIDEKKFPAIKIGDIKNLKVGQRVYAIGSPMGFENTISEGIISGLRSYEDRSKNYLQITASISPGSSGGAVVNNKGELIGISTSTIQEGQNLNFAIPIDEILNVEIGSYVKENSYKTFELFYKGVERIKNGGFSTATYYFSLFLNENPNHATAYLNRGYAKSKFVVKDLVGAINDYTKAIEINPNYAFAYTNRAVAKSELGDYYGALLDNNKAIEIDPSDPVAYHNRGRDKYFLEDFIGAIKDFSKAIELNDNYAGAYYNRGITKYMINDLSGACLDLSNAGELGYYDAYEVIKEICN